MPFFVVCSLVVRHASAAVRVAMRGARALGWVHGVARLHADAVLEETIRRGAAFNRAYRGADLKSVNQEIQNAFSNNKK